MFVILAGFVGYLGFVSAGFEALFGFILFFVIRSFVLRLLKLFLGQLILFVCLLVGFFVGLVN